ncbi:calcium ATPase [Peniophora sp. CONT]|nr:calcium ATPase [Peniophora sp. CONT]
MGRTDCFVVSGSRVLEGVGRYVVIAVGTKSFNGRLVLFVGLMIRLFVELGTGVPAMTPAQKGVVFVNILIISVTLVVVAVPEGFHWHVVCSDKTGTLTQNEITVVAGSVSIHAEFVRDLANNVGRADAEASSKPGSPSTEAQRPRRFADDFPLELSDLDQVLSPALLRLLRTPENGTRIFVGSKTETALLKMAMDLKWDNYRKTREGKGQLQVVPFSSERKAMDVVVRHGREAQFYVKSASEILVDRCTLHVVVSKPGEGKNGNDEIETDGLNADDKENVSRTITFYAGQSLRTIAICYRDFEQWPPAEVSIGENGEVPYDSRASELVVISIIGIEDPLREDIRGAVADCSHAGVQVKMCTGDDVLKARDIARQFGIYTLGGTVMEGPVPLSPAPVPKTSAPWSTRSSASKKSMGIAGTEVAKEASDIILMDDNFASIVKAIMWGRAVNDAVRKFLQFQISMNVTTVVITIVSGLASSGEVSVLTAVQRLCINIIVDTFAALALATDPATTASLDRKPDRKWAPLFSCDMLKQILGQSAYQSIIILIFHFLGAKILGSGGDETDKRFATLVFKALVFPQIFNSFNCRRLDRRFNIFEGMTRNWWFIGITLIEIGAQILIVFIGGAAFSVTRMAGHEWGISLALGFVSIPLGALIRLIPNGPCERLFSAVRLLPRDPSPLPTTAPGTPEPGLGFALDMLRNNFATFHHVRGGRVRSSSFVVRSMNAAGIAPQKKPANIMAATMSPSLLELDAAWWSR